MVLVFSLLSRRDFHCGRGFSTEGQGTAEQTLSFQRIQTGWEHTPGAGRNYFLGWWPRQHWAPGLLKHEDQE